MNYKCRYARKKKNILKGYFWCTKDKKVRKGYGRTCYCWWYKPYFPISLFVGIKEWFEDLLWGIKYGR